MKTKITKVLYLLALLLVLVWIVMLINDYLYSYPFGSAPFYVYVLVRTIEFILPGIALLVIGKVLSKKHG